jgi:hypothetical protein
MYTLAEIGWWRPALVAGALAIGLVAILAIEDFLRWRRDRRDTRGAKTGPDDGRRAGEFPVLLRGIAPRLERDQRLPFAADARSRASASSAGACSKCEAAASHAVPAARAAPSRR